MQLKASLIKHLAVAFLSLATLTVQGATLLSTVDRNQIGVGETVLLTISYDAQVSSNQLNLNGIEQNWNIIGFKPHSSNSISIVNGKRTQVATTQWQLSLEPKESGDLLIPSFQVESATSNPIRVQVSTSSPGQPSDRPLSVSVKLDKDTVFVGEQLIVEVEASIASDVSSLQMTAFTLDSDEAIQLSDDTFQRVSNGIARQIVVRKYAVFAQSAGELALPQLTLSGEKGGGRSIFSQRGKSVIARSDPVSINVENAQITTSGAWFPASNVSITSDWSSDVSAVKTGEPITRTITLSAVGQRSKAIPPLVLGSNGTYNSYQDKPQLLDKSSGADLIGSMVVSEAIVPTRAGKLVLPEINIRWWNTVTGKVETSSLPAQELTVLQAAEKEESDLGSIPNNADNSDQRLPDTKQIKSDPADSQYWKMAVLALAVICSFQFWLLLKQRVMRKTVQNTNNIREQKNTAKEKEQWANLLSAFKSNDLIQVRANIISWSRQYLSNTHFTTFGQNSLEPLKLAASSEALQSLSELLNHLDQTIYGTGDQPIALEKLQIQLELFRSKQKSMANAKTTTGEALPALYPQR